MRVDVNAALKLASIQTYTWFRRRQLSSPPSTGQSIAKLQFFKIEGNLFFTESRVFTFQGGKWPSV